jgi:hypothetical protein
MLEKFSSLKRKKLNPLYWIREILLKVQNPYRVAPVHHV